IAADSDTQALAVAVILNQPYEDLPSFQFLVNQRNAAVGPAAPDEVRLARRHGESERGQAGRKPCASRQDFRSRFSEVRLVLNRGGRGSEAQYVAVIRVLYLDHIADERRVGDGVTEANAGQA